MVDLGVTEKDFHTKWYLTGRKNDLLKELADSDDSGYIKANALTFLEKLEE